MSLTDSEIAYLRNKLLHRQRVLIAEVRDELKRSDNESYAALAGQVRDIGDDSVADLLTDLAAGQIHRQLVEIQRIEKAIQRIDNKQYGECEECDGEIGYQRLLAQPTATRCIYCQSQFENHHFHEEHASL